MLLRIHVIVEVATSGAVWFLWSLALCSLMAMNRTKRMVNKILVQGFWTTSSLKAMVMEINPSKAPKSFSLFVNFRTVMTWYIAKKNSSIASQSARCDAPSAILARFFSNYTITHCIIGRRYSGTIKYDFVIYVVS